MYLRHLFVFKFALLLMYVGGSRSVIMLSHFTDCSTVACTKHIGRPRFWYKTCVFWVRGPIRCPATPSPSSILAWVRACVRAYVCLCFTFSLRHQYMHVLTYVFTLHTCLKWSLRMRHLKHISNSEERLPRMLSKPSFPPTVATIVGATTRRGKHDNIQAVPNAQYPGT